MSILIKSREEMHAFLKTEESADFHVILITDPKIRATNPNEFTSSDTLHVGDIKRNCKKELLHLNFHDVEHASEGSRYVKASPEDVKSALDWAKGKEKIAIACMAGISRSSAIAVLIKLERSNLDEALNILDRKRHWPNKLIIKHGSDLLGNPELYGKIATWLNQTAIEVSEEIEANSQDDDGNS